MSSRSPAAVALALLALGGFACAQEPESAWRPLEQIGQPGQWPVSRVEPLWQYNRIHFYPDPAVHWTTLVNTDLFEGFEAGMTIEQARKAVGEPDFEEQRQNGDFWIYERPLGQVVLSHEDKGSLVGSKWWVLRGVPRHREPKALLHPQVLQHLEFERPGQFQVFVMRQDRTAGAVVTIKAGQVQSVQLPKSQDAAGFRTESTDTTDS